MTVPVRESAMLVGGVEEIRNLPKTTREPRVMIDNPRRVHRVKARSERSAGIARWWPL